VIERTINTSVEKVWSAITEKEKISQWLFPIDAFKAEVGFEFRFIGGKDNISYLHICKVTEVIQNQRLSYSWRYEGFPGNSLVTFELTPKGNQTHLKIIHAGLDTFPVSNPDFLNGSYIPDWANFLHALKINSEQKYFYHEN
jgi:uncharacterized protein YndB with AHSA1/START domain